MHRVVTVTGQAAPVKTLRRRFSNNSTAVLESMICSKRIQEVVGDELMVYRSPSTLALHIQLNRPTKLNALSFAQCKYLSYLYPHIHSVSPEICSAIVITGAGEKAFCAGGDIKSLTTSDDPKTFCEEFFAHEYCMDLWTKAINKPYISIWDGIVFGGGVGISIHGEFRIATETTVFAMPETAIGLLPDVGATHFFSRLPDGIGLYLGLTGHRLNATDVVDLGLATHYIPKLNMPKLMHQLLGDEFSESTSRNKYLHRSDIEKILTSLDKRPQIPPTLSPEELNNRLSKGIEGNEPFAIQMAHTLKTMCPLSCGTWIEQHRRGPRLNLSQCISLEYRLCQSFYSNDPHNNFKEGVRALLVDRSGDPKWNPTSLLEVTSEEIKSHFEWTGARELFSFPGVQFPILKQ